MASVAVRLPRSAAPSRRLLGEAAAGLAVAALAALVTWVAVRRGMTVLGVAPLLVIAGTVWLAATRRTLLALAIFMLYVGALDGYLKLATGSGLITFLRDGLLFAIAVGLLVRAQVEGRRLTVPPLTAWVAAFIVLVLVQVLNPDGGTFVHSLAGVRQHLEFVPLFFLTFAYVRTTKALRGFVILLLVLAAANGVVSWAQFSLTPEQLAAWGPGYSERVLGKEGFANSARIFADEEGNDRTRPFGLGSESGSGGIAGALALGCVAALAALATIAGRLRYLLLAVLLGLGAITAVVTSQGRGVIVCSVVVVFAYGLLLATSRGRIGGVLALAVAGILSLLIVQSIIGSVGSSNLRYEGLSPSEIVKTTTEAREGNLTAIGNAVKDHPLGAGLATAGPASVAPGGNALTGNVDAESEFAFLTIETGIPGLLLMTAFPIALFALALTRIRNEPDREARLLLAALIAPMAGLLALYYPGTPTPTTPTGPYLWAVGGIVAYWLVARPAARRGAAGA